MSKKMGRPKHIASATVLEDAKDVVLLDKFLSVPEFAKHNCRTYTREQMARAVMGYVLTGSNKKASQVSGVKDVAIRKWRHENKWWEQCAHIAKEVLSEKLEDKFTSILNETLTQLEKRLADGDVAVKNGELINVPVKASELSRILSVLFDRRQLLRGDVTSRSESKTSGSRLDEIKKIAESVVAADNS